MSLLDKQTAEAKMRLEALQVIVFLNTCPFFLQEVKGLPEYIEFKHKIAAQALAGNLCRTSAPIM